MRHCDGRPKLLCDGYFVKFFPVAQPGLRAPYHLVAHVAHASLYVWFIGNNIPACAELAMESGDGQVGTYSRRRLDDSKRQQAGTGNAPTAWQRPRDLFLYIRRTAYLTILTGTL